MKSRLIPFLTALIIIETLILVAQNLYWAGVFDRIALRTEAPVEKTPAGAVTSPFLYTFNVDGALQEAGEMDESSSPYFWLNSGGLLYLIGGTGATIGGELPSLSRWRIAYARSNPGDTDDGYHPQNIFRLITRSSWGNVEEEAYFRILKDNLSGSSNRNASNGILLLSRYRDGDNLYYAGLRVDGAAVIKKKINGDYFTLAYVPLLKGPPYDRSRNPTLLPKETWIGLRTRTVDNEDGSVTVTLFADIGETGNWKKVAEARDRGGSSGGPPLRGEAHMGIRTDFMNVEFKKYRLERIGA